MWEFILIEYRFRRLEYRQQNKLPNFTEPISFIETFGIEWLGGPVYKKYKKEGEEL